VVYAVVFRTGNVIIELRRLEALPDAERETQQSVARSRAR
jgi:hypothetical protein